MQINIPCGCLGMGGLEGVDYEGNEETYGVRGISIILILTDVYAWCLFNRCICMSEVTKFTF